MVTLADWGCAMGQRHSIAHGAWYYSSHWPAKSNPIDSSDGCLMISLEDCVGLSGLTEEEVLAIAEHEHIPEIAASALGQYLSRQERGIEQIRDMIVHDIRQAQQGQDKQHTVMLLHVLHHFLKAHPNQHPWSSLY
jgi:Rad3-related DNA helicase